MLSTKVSPRTRGVRACSSGGYPAKMNFAALADDPIVKLAFPYIVSIAAAGWSYWTSRRLEALKRELASTLAKENTILGIASKISWNEHGAHPGLLDLEVAFAALRSTCVKQLDEWSEELRDIRIDSILKVAERLAARSAKSISAAK